MKNAILTISDGIIAAADKFGTNIAKFDITKVPSKEWGENVTVKTSRGDIKKVSVYDKPFTHICHYLGDCDYKCYNPPSKTELKDNELDYSTFNLGSLKYETNELIKIIVKCALAVIVGVGIVTTILYWVAIVTNQDTQIIGSTWSNMFSVLLTNAFSIVGTIMGIKYATQDSKK